jgi:hypothetical protein
MSARVTGSRSPVTDHSDSRELESQPLIKTPIQPGPHFF